jgi:pilus assembly protein CpaB
MNRNTRLAAVLAIAVAAAAAASYAVYIALTRMPVRQVEVGTVPVVVASRTITVGTLLTKDHVKIVGWPVKAQVPGAFSSVDLVVNRGAIESFSENEPITGNRLAPEGAGAGLPPTIPPGMRAISVRVNEVIGVAGFVVPGTRVDVLVTLRGSQMHETMTRAVVGNVPVLTAGTRFDQEKSREEGKPIPTSVVTLLVSPEDAERVALAASEGTITLTLRNPLDTLPAETTGARMASLTGEPAAAPAQPAAQRRTGPRTSRIEPVDPDRPYTVETIRAAKRTQESVR